MVDYLADFGQPLSAGQPLARILIMDNYGDGNALNYLRLEEDCLPILAFSNVE